MALNISLDDLVIAYRKTKADAFFENGHHTALSFAEYEANLFNNLKDLLNKLYSKNNNWLKRKEIVGTYAIILKTGEDSKKNQYDKKEEFVYYSNNNRQWDKTKNVEVGFRIIGQHPVNFHILSSLWIDKVGYRLEKAVSENSYGCRLKRRGQTAKVFVPNYNENSEPDKLQLGHFRPYLGDYQRWQQNGMEAINHALKQDKKVLAVTADLKKFYHSIDPSFLLNDDFLTTLKLEVFSETEKKLTELLITSIGTWSNYLMDDPIVPEEFKKNQHCGVPLGLGASKVIANLLLAYFDKEIETELLPIYYGRYVDDIFLVLEDNGNINTRVDFWAFLGKRMSHLNTQDDSQENIYESEPIFNVPYAANSLLAFGAGKEKLFLLEGSSGAAFVETLQDSLNENSSEWKMLPDSEEDLEALAQEMTKASSDLEEAVNGLRKSDGVSIQRLKFALHLRNFEAIVLLLPKQLWSPGVQKFFSLAEDFIIAPDKIATYAKYYPRLIRLAIRAEEPKKALEIWNLVDASWIALKGKTSRKDGGTLKLASDYNTKLLEEAVYTSLPIGLKKNKNWDGLFRKTNYSFDELSQLNELLFFSDLHAVPFRRIFFEEEIQTIWTRQTNELGFFDQLKSLNDVDFRISERKDFVKNTLELYDNSDGNTPIFLPKALFFYTRPFTTLEITQLYPEWVSAEGLKKIKIFLDLFNIPLFEADIPPFGKTGDQSTITPPGIIQININDGSDDLNRVFALTSFQTEEKSWVAWVRDDNKEPDDQRYTRLFRIINQIISCRTKINYVVFPELSIPRKVLFYIALKLKKKGISLIAGIEYKKRDKPSHFPQNIKGLVSNQLVYILNTRTLGSLEQVCIVQEKTIPAIHEERELYDIGGKWMVPLDESKYLINHGGFFFSGLICNDLLNIDNRQYLRGKIDALIVIEWNKDVDMYDSLVQSSSSDLHSFILQVNNRKFGDTRLRGPYKEAYERDKVRVRGGELDYFVVTTLEVEKLREFQRNHRSPDKPFKPVPTGFEMSNERRKK